NKNLDNKINNKDSKILDINIINIDNKNLDNNIINIDNKKLDNNRNNIDNKILDNNRNNIDNKILDKHGNNIDNKTLDKHGNNIDNKNLDKHGNNIVDENDRADNKIFFENSNKIDIKNSNGLVGVGKIIEVNNIDINSDQDTYKNINIDGTSINDLEEYMNNVLSDVVDNYTDNKNTIPSYNNLKNINNYHTNHDNTQSTTRVCFSALNQSSIDQIKHKDTVRNIKSDQNIINIQDDNINNLFDVITDVVDGKKSGSDDCTSLRDKNLHYKSNNSDNINCNNGIENINISNNIDITKSSLFNTANIDRNLSRDNKNTIDIKNNIQLVNKNVISNDKSLLVSPTTLFSYHLQSNITNNFNSSSLSLNNINNSNKNIMNNNYCSNNINIKTFNKFNTDGNIQLYKTDKNLINTYENIKKQKMIRIFI
ncbi:hypothetical protein EDEG_03390, partial [Edhazardia aedis USNM 41457]